MFFRGLGKHLFSCKILDHLIETYCNVEMDGVLIFYFIIIFFYELLELFSFSFLAYNRIWMLILYSALSDQPILGFSYA